MVSHKKGILTSETKRKKSTSLFLKIGEAIAIVSLKYRHSNNKMMDSIIMYVSKRKAITEASKLESKGQNSQMECVRLICYIAEK